MKYKESKNFRVFIEIAVKLFSYVTDTLWDSINFSVSDDIDVDDFTCKLFTKPVGFCSWNAEIPGIIFPGFTLKLSSAKIIYPYFVSFNLAWSPSVT